MKTFCLMLFLSFYVLVTKAQTMDTTVYEIVEKGAQPEMGYPYFYDYLKKNLKFPFTDGRNTFLKGCFVNYLELLINEKGESTLQKITPKGCYDIEHTNLILKNIKWIPAEHKGSKVKQKIVIPIRIRLG